MSCRASGSFSLRLQRQPLTSLPILLQSPSQDVKPRHSPAHIPSFSTNSLRQVFSCSDHQDSKPTHRLQIQLLLSKALPKHPHQGGVMLLPPLTRHLPKQPQLTQHHIRKMAASIPHRGVKANQGMLEVPFGIITRIDRRPRRSSATRTRQIAFLTTNCDLYCRYAPHWPEMEVVRQIEKVRY
jgi:hypothetical protein